MPKKKHIRNKHKNCCLRLSVVSKAIGKYIVSHQPTNQPTTTQQTEKKPLSDDTLRLTFKSDIL